MTIAFSFGALLENDMFKKYLHKVIAIAVLCVLMLVSVKLTKALFRRILSRPNVLKEKKTHLALTKSIIVAIIYIFFIAIMLSQFDELKSLGTSLLAGSGIAALAIGLAAQDAIGNVIGGIFISLFQPFKIGDTITYVDKNLTGVVEDITVRHTVIRTFNNKRLIIPNGLINKEIVENSNYSDDKVCVFLDLDIAYTSNTDKAIGIITDEAVKHPDFLDIRNPEEIMQGRSLIHI